MANGTKKNQENCKWNEVEVSIINIKQSGIQQQKPLTESKKNISKVNNNNPLRGWAYILKTLSEIPRAKTSRNMKKA